MRKATGSNPVLPTIDCKKKEARLSSFLFWGVILVGLVFLLFMGEDCGGEDAFGWVIGGKAKDIEDR